MQDALVFDQEVFMINESNLRRLSCYAVIKSGYTGNSFFAAHMRLVLALIAKKAYTHIDAAVLVGDFPNEYGYSIDYFPMRQILNLAIQQGYLTKQNNRNRYFATDKIQSCKRIEEEITNSKASIRRITSSFITFSQKCNVEYNEEAAVDILLAYVNTQKLHHAAGRIDALVDDKRVDHIFGKFVIYLKEYERRLFSDLTTLVIGSILADYLTYEEIIGDTNTLVGTTFIIDTSVAFMALGLDLANRAEYYKTLINSLRSKGAHVVVFRHSYDEMQQIILGAAEWVDNYKYDPVYASDVAVYFHDHGATKDDVLEYSTLLKNKLHEIGIETLDVDYTEENRASQISETRIQQMIVERYKSTNPDFDEEKKKKSIDLDVKSLSLVYLLRNGAAPVFISDSKYLFVTANRTLNKVAFEFHQECTKQSKTLPVSVTDVFLGTYLWLSDPIKIVQMNEQRMLANAYLAFQPSTELIAKLSRTVDHLLESGEIDAKTCYTLKSNHYVMERLAEKTLGDPDAYDETTPLDILKDVREEGKKEGIEESSRKHKIELAVQKEEHDKLMAASRESKRELINELLNTAQMAVDEKEKALAACKDRLKIAGIIKFIIKVVIALVYCGFIGALAYGIFRLAVISQSEPINYLDVVLAVWPIFAQAVISVISWFTVKEFNPWAILKTLVESCYVALCRKMNCSEIEIQVINDEIDQLNARKRCLEQEEEKQTSIA